MAHAVVVARRPCCPKRADQTGDDATCDGTDDDCDGTIDEDHIAGTSTCGVGACSGNIGTVRCDGGVLDDSCDAMAGATGTDATCDGVDYDCDGVADDDYAATATLCGVGACEAGGVLPCVLGVIVDSCEPLSAASATDFTCDGEDDDCDGSTGEDFGSSSTSWGGVRAMQGTRTAR